MDTLNMSIISLPASCSDLEEQHELGDLPFPTFAGHIDSEQGFYVIYKHDLHYIVSNPPDYKCTSKRLFLNEMIRQLYVVIGMEHCLRWLPTFPITDRQKLWYLVDLCLRPERLSVEALAMRHLKRKLFRESQKSRKMLRSQVRRSIYWGTTNVSHFKPIRQHIGRQRVSRTYLDEARRNVLLQLETVADEMIEEPTQTVCDDIAVEETIFNEKPSVMQTLTERARNIFEKERARLAEEKTQYIMEESVRSAIYAKQLFHLIENPEELANVENEMLENGC